MLNAVPAGDQGLEIGGQTANNLNWKLFSFGRRLFMASVAVSLLVSCLLFLLWRPYRRHWYSRCHYLSATIAAGPSLTSGRLAPPPSNSNFKSNGRQQNANDQLINCTLQSDKLMIHMSRSECHRLILIFYWIKISRIRPPDRYIQSWKMADVSAPVIAAA